MDVLKLANKIDDFKAYYSVLFIIVSKLRSMIKVKSVGPSVSSRVNRMKKPRSL